MVEDDARVDIQAAVFWQFSHHKSFATTNHSSTPIDEINLSHVMPIKINRIQEDVLSLSFSLIVVVWVWVWLPIPCTST